MPLLEYACVKCGPLDVVSKVLAILHLIGYIISALAWFVIVYMVFIATTFAEGALETSFRAHGGSSGNSLLDDIQRQQANSVQDLIKLHLGVIKFVVVFYEIIFIMQVILLCVMIHGIRKENRRLLFPWMIVQAVTIVWCIIAFIIVLALFKSNTPVNWGIGLPANIIFACWFLLVVYSLYQQMGERVAGRNDINMK